MKLTYFLSCVLLLTGCANISQVNEDIRKLNVPKNWQFSGSGTSVTDNWLQQFNQPILNELVEEALNNNQSLKQAAFDVRILKQQLHQSDADLWPTLDLNLATNRTKSTEPNAIANNSSVALNVGYEVDIWGKLSAARKQASLTYFSGQAQYQQNRQALVADVVSDWFDLITATQLSDLFQLRVDNAKQSLQIIESSYQQGLNAALDVYLSRNELNTELANLAEQEVNLIQSARSLERLLGRYPHGKLISAAQHTALPLLSSEIPIGLPSAIITRKPELLASWYQVLAQDAALAFAHKQRFPSINLTASLSDSTDELADLLSSSSFAWSLLGSLSAPLFRAGELKANEEISRLQLKQQEQAYLNDLYDAFASVENAVTTENSLKQRYQATLAAQQNAQAAEKLAFEQYQRGLVTYTTVLEAQSRYFNAQSALLQIKNQLLTNRVDLHIALGGDFAMSDVKQQEVKTNE